MPIERVVEYKITMPKSAALDVIFRIGLLRFFMPIDRPSKLPAPSVDQEVYEYARKISDFAKSMTRYYGGQAVGKLRIRARNFREFVNTVYKNGEEAIARIRQLEDSIRGLEDELTRYMLYRRVAEMGGVAGLRNVRYMVLRVPSRTLSDFENAIGRFNDVIEVKLASTADETDLLLVMPAWEYASISSIVNSYGGIKVVEPPESMDLSFLDSRIRDVENSLNSLRGQLRSFIEDNRAVINGILEAASIIDKVLQTYMNSVTEEGGDVIDRIDVVRGQIAQLEGRLTNANILLRAYELLLRNGIESVGISNIPYTLFVVSGKLPEDLEKYSGYVIASEGDLTIYMTIGEVEYRAPNVIKAPREHLVDIRSSIELLRREISEGARRLDELRRELDELIKDRDEACSYSLEEARKLKDVVTIRGFVLRRDEDEFDQALYRILADLAVEASVRKYSRVMQISDVNPDEAPTAEEYPQPVDAFREVVYMYGIPRYNELSPVVLTSIIFPVFFGWMFPDAGQGAILLLFGILMNKLRYSGSNSILRAMFSGKANLWGTMFTMMGTWAIVFSVLNSGEVFGADLIHPLFPWGHVFEQGTISEAWISWTLSLAMLFGFTLLTIALALKVANRFMMGHRLDALVSMWIIPSFIGFGLIMMNVGIVPVALLNSSLAVLLTPQVRLLGFALLAVGLGGFSGSMGYVKSHEAEVELAELIVALAVEGILDAIANTLSFMRLGIIALVHSIFTYMLYQAASSMGILTPMGLFLMVFGNALIIAGEGFLTFIQTSRLTFYEMFSKFYLGTGKPYSPLSFNLNTLSIET